MIPKNWIAVASADHVKRGVEGGFMQVCHGKAAPLRRINAADRVVYYSPTQTMGVPGRLQAFTAIGTVKSGEPYPFDMGGGFVPYRRDVQWLPAKDAPIHPLLDVLSFSAGVRNWGYRFRFGLFEVTEQDMAAIATAMEAELYFTTAKSTLA